MQAPNNLVYRFIESAIRPGDILLSTDRTAKASNLIRKATRSPYSHAAICCNPPEFLEAIGTGVSRLNVTRLFVQDKSYVAIMRLKADFQRNAETALNAARAAGFYLGNDYWKSGALSSLFSMTPARKRNAVFCSHLVATAYEEAGVELVQDTSSEKITPALIAASPILENVTDSVLEPIAYGSAILWGKPLEKGLGDSPHRNEVDASRKVRDYVNAWLREHDLPEQENFHQLLNFLRDFPSEAIRQAMDAFFVLGVREAGYLEVLPQHFPPEYPSFQLSTILQGELAKGMVTDKQKQHLVRFYKDGRTTMLEDSKQKSYLKQWLENAWEYRRLETFRLLAENQRHVCEVGDKFLVEVDRCLQLLREDMLPLEQHGQ